MSIVQKSLILSLATLAFAIPQAQLEQRQATTTPAPTLASTCRVGETSTAVSCLTRFTGLANSFCKGFAGRTTSTIVVTTNPTTTVTSTQYTSTIFSSTDVITNTSTITSTTTVTQFSNITSGLSTSLIPVEATSTITSYDYLCSATAEPLARRQATATLRPRASCVAYLSDYRDQWGRNNACSCVRSNPTRTTVVTETSTVLTGTTVTQTETETADGVLTNGIATSTSLAITTITTISTELRNNTIPIVTPVITTTGTSYTTVTVTTPTPIPTQFKLTVSVDSTTYYARDVTVNDGTGLAFNSTSSQGRNFNINPSNQLVNEGLFLSVFTEATPNAIPFLFWRAADQVDNQSDILSVNACNGTLTVNDGEGDVFALCEGLDQDRLLALGARDVFERNGDVCTVVDVQLDPGFVGEGNGTVTTVEAGVKARATYYRPG